MNPRDPTRLDLYGSLSHYMEHMLPIWWALPSDRRGYVWAVGSAHEEARRAGVGPDALLKGRPRRPGRLTLVASSADMLAVADRPLALLNHGSGQVYQGHPHAAYSGGPDRHDVVLFLCPSEQDAARNREAYPGALSVAVGVPKLDPWHGDGGGRVGAADVSRVRRTPTPDPESGVPTVAFSFHWPCRLCPESTWAWPEYREALEALAADADRGYRLLGHAHPRAYGRLGPWWTRQGVPATPRFTDVLDQADLYVADNSSTLYEFASTGRPVVLLNASWYRRDVHHGGRFWDWADVGLQVDDPARLGQTIASALLDPPAVRERRAEVVRQVYSCSDGSAAVRAASVICSVIDERTAWTA